jgi:tetratricopeptide (TPR) repeat protein
MNANKFAIILFLSFFPLFGHAEWMSDVDKKYQKDDPELYSDVLKAKTLISEAYGKTNNYHQAAAILLAVVEKNQKFTPAYVQLARVSSKLGHQSNDKYEAAALSMKEDYLNKALSLEPKYDYAIALMGYTKMFQGHLDEAEMYYNQVIEMKSGYPWLKVQLAKLARLRGDHKKAIQLATDGYEEYKAKSEPKIAAGMARGIISAYIELERAGGNYNKELDYWYTQRTTLDPSVAWGWGDYAQFKLLNLGDADSAIEYGEKALSIMNYGMARRVVAGAYYKKWADLKDDKAHSVEANEAWKKAQVLYPDTLEIIREFMFYPQLKSTAEALLAKENQRDLTP